jgi:hypothetical protein
MAQGFTRTTVGGTLLVTGSIYYITCSYAESSSYSHTSSYTLSASYAPSTPSGRAVGLCAAYTPLSIGADAAEIPIPYNTDGITPITWAIKRINIRTQISESISSSIAIEKSNGNGIFSATEIGRILLPSTSYETFTGSISSTIASGEKIRFNVIELGTAQNWTLLVEITPS